MFFFFSGMRSLNFDWKPGMPEKDQFIVTGCSTKKTKTNDNMFSLTGGGRLMKWRSAIGTEWWWLALLLYTFDMAPCNSDHQDYYMFRIGDSYQPSLSTVTGRGPYPIYTSFFLKQSMHRIFKPRFGWYFHYMLVNHGKPTMHGSIPCQW